MANRYTQRNWENIYELAISARSYNEYCPQVSCIYKITNEKSGKFYIGSAINFNRRMREHKKNLNAQKHCNPILQSSFNKTGIEWFTSEVLEIVEDPQELIKREQYYIDTLNPYINIQRIVESTNLGRKFVWSEEQKAAHKKRMKEYVFTDEQRQWFSEFHKGRKRSKETCKNISKALTGKKLSKEHILSLEKGKMPKGCVVAQYDKSTMNLINTYETVGTAARETDFNPRSMTNCLNKRGKSLHGFIWEYKKIEDVK